MLYVVINVIYISNLLNALFFNFLNNFNGKEYVSFLIIRIHNELLIKCILKEKGVN